MKDMSGMSHGGMSMTSTGTAAQATSAMGGMDMGGGMDMSMGECKMSMLWNWYTIDACFISMDWHVTSSGMFAGSCIAAIVMVIALEFVRRASKEYDRLLVQQHLLRRTQLARPQETSGGDQSPANSAQNDGAAKVAPAMVGIRSALGSSNKFRPTFSQQIVRALLHMFQFALAYFIMLLAMAFNGYIIICILIGAFLGGFIFTWETIDIGETKEELTMCCG